VAVSALRRLRPGHRVPADMQEQHHRHTINLSFTYLLTFASLQDCEQDICSFLRLHYGKITNGHKESILDNVNIDGILFIYQASRPTIFRHRSFLHILTNNRETSS